MNQYRANTLLNERIAQIQEQLNAGAITAAQSVELTGDAQDRHQHAVYRAYAAAGDHLIYENGVPHIMINGERVDGEYFQLVERLIAENVIRDFYAEI